MIKALSRNAARLQRLTDDILDVTRIESETLMLKIEPLDLDDMISNIVDDYRNQIEKNNDNVKLLYYNNNITDEPEKNNDSKIIVEEIRNEIFPKLGVKRLIRKPIRMDDLVKDLRDELQ